MRKILTVIIFAALMAIFPKTAVAGYEQEVGSAGILKLHSTVTDEREVQLSLFLGSQDSTLAGISGHLIREADRLSLDWRLVAAIAGLESTYCKRIPTGSFNCWGWGIPTGASSGLAFASYANGVTTVSEGLREKYLNRGLATVEEIGRVYAASPTWASRVRYIMNQITAFEPTPAEKITVTI